MKQQKTYLKAKLIEFQTRIVEMARQLREQKDQYEAREKELFLNLLEILDAFENLDEMIKAKQGQMDKSAKRMAKNIRNINKKLMRILKAHHITPIELDEGKAQMELCKIVDTKPDEALENETILDVIKTGYKDNRKDAVLRKAEVVTVLNDD